MRLVRPGSSIALTHGPEALMLVQAGERLDVYDTQTGMLMRSLDLRDSIPACRWRPFTDGGRRPDTRGTGIALVPDRGISRLAARRLGRAQGAQVRARPSRST